MLKKESFEDDFDDDELANIYGGDRNYCPDCGSSRYYDGHCYNCGDPLDESAEDIEDDELNQNSWVVVNIEPRLNNYVSLVPIKVDIVNKRVSSFVGWAWGEHLHKYNQSSILYKTDSEEDAMKFIENHKGIKVSELIEKDLKK